MSRSEKNILEDVKKLAVEYYDLTGKPLGATGEIAEYMAADTLGLTLCEARSEGYDAYGANNQKIQIKGRRVGPSGKWGRVPSINTNKEFNVVQLVLMDSNYDLVEIWEADRNAVVTALNKPGSKSRNERRSMSVSQFKNIGTKLFPKTPQDAVVGKKVCPECGHVFKGNGWDGIDAHWRSKHEHIMPYEEAWPLLKSGKYDRNM